MKTKTKYEQARELLRSCAESLSPGTKLPPIKRLQEELGISQWTLNKAIQELALEGALYLIPNRGAFVSQTRRANSNIGLLWPEIFDRTTATLGSQRPYVATVMDSIRVHAAALGRNLVVLSNTTPLESSLVSGDDNIAGLMIHFAYDQHLIDAYRGKNIPVVLINPLIPMPEVPFVCNDDFGTFFNATKHLLALGHRRIVHATLDRHLSLPSMPGVEFFENRIVNERIRGYEQAMQVAEQDCSISVYRLKNGSREARETAFLDMLDAVNPTALCCLNDWVAAKIYRICERNGIRIPQDLSVIGYDGYRIGGHEWSPLTTMQAPSTRIGQAAVEMLDAMIKEQRLNGDGLVLSSRLVEGASTGPPSNGRQESLAPNVESVSLSS